MGAKPPQAPCATSQLSPHPGATRALGPLTLPVSPRSQSVVESDGPGAQQHGGGVGQRGGRAGARAVTLHGRHLPHRVLQRPTGVGAAR